MVIRNCGLGFYQFSQKYLFIFRDFKGFSGLSNFTKGISNYGFRKYLFINYKYHIFVKGYFKDFITILFIC